MRGSITTLALLLSVAMQAPATPPPVPPTSDANGNPLRRAVKTGHVSNYDEAKVPAYTLPAPLVATAGRPVRSASDWRQRREEIVGLYEQHIFGRVPANAPKVTWRVSATDAKGRDGAAIVKQVVGQIGPSAEGPRINLTLVTPATARTGVPIVLIVNFGGGNTTPPTSGQWLPLNDPPVAAEILARGWGYAMFGYQDVQPDRANALTQGAIGLTLLPGASQPDPAAWGSVSAWAWGTSRAIDFLEGDPSVDRRRIALQGFSRIGKAALWAAALDERIAAVFAACAGEMGSALSRRDYGETVDDMAQNFPWWFSGTFQQWPGRWQEMPVDAHMLIALSAPRPVFLTGGTGDQWADPRGIFLAAVAAGPVYRLLGKKDMGITEFPPPDTPVIAGSLGWLYHTGGHNVPATDWRPFLDFLAPHFAPDAPPVRLR
jgi:hypothetical protein